MKQTHSYLMLGVCLTLLLVIYKRPTPGLFAKLAEKHQVAVWWVVGPPGMVSVTVNGLHLGGISADKIMTESFDGY